MKVSTCIILFFVLNLCNCAKIPSDFIKCDRKREDFRKCLAKAVQDAMTKMTKPIRELGLPSLDPLEVPELTIAAGTSAVGLQQKFKNLKIYGVNNLECSKMDVDFEKKIIENLCFYPEIRLEADYELDGKILLLEIHGKGPGSVVLEKVKVGVTYKMEEYVNNGKSHWKVVEITERIDPERVYYHVEKAFENVDKTISKNIIDVINENWKEVFDDVKPHYEDAFGQITRSVFNSVLAKIPIDEIF